MRVTEHRLIQLASLATSRARDSAARAGEALSTGVAVDRPSADPNRWAEGKAAQARQAVSEGRGRAIATARSRLDDADRSFDSIGEMMRRAQELAVQLSNGPHSDTDRANAALEVASIRDSVRALANQQSGDGEFALAGTAGTVRPFDDTGAYQGTDGARRVATGEGDVQQTGVTGALLTASHGIDILGTLDSLVAAMNRNDAAAIRASLEPLRTGIDQVASARSEVGVRMGALDLAESARQGLTQRLDETFDRNIAADPIEAASAFAQAAQTLEAARAAAQKLISLAGV